MSANADRLGAEVHELQEALTAADTAEEDDAAAHAAELHRLQVWEGSMLLCASTYILHLLKLSSSSESQVGSK